METDNDPVDQNLLLQFTCLGTTDKDDLVKQFRELIDKVNDTTATFFLEMNNWNLQNAICSFLDYETPTNLPAMTLEESHQLSTASPNTNCVMWWTVRNIGNEPWPRDVSLQYTGGNHHCDVHKIPVSHIVYPRQCTTFVVDFTAPSEPGWYHSTWKMMTSSGVYFGDSLSLVFQVLFKLEDEEEANLSEELASRMALRDPIDMEEGFDTADPVDKDKSMHDQDQEIS